MATLRALGVEFRSVLDVGVFNDTPALRSTFPGLMHHLFEPVQAHFPSIERTYASVRYILHPIAVSNVDGEAFLNTFSSTDGPQTITRSEVSDRSADSASDPTLISSIRIQKRKLDTVMLNFNEKPYLLKVDVDGPDLQVLQGAVRTLQSCAAVVIETPLMEIPERSKYLTDRGFRLVDIVDLSYYHGIMWQVDMVFLSAAILESNERLRLLRSESQLDPAHWYTAGYEE
jgi:FkbM family methyltransferase